MGGSLRRDTELFDMKIQALPLIVAVLIGVDSAAARAADTATVTGYAYDCVAEHALPGATVVFRNGTDVRTVTTRGDGSFSALGLTPGTYAVELRGDVVVQPPFPPPLLGGTMRIGALTSTRTLTVVPNDYVSMRIGIGPTNNIGHPRTIKCDPDLVAVTAGPVERTTVISH